MTGKEPLDAFALPPHPEVDNPLDMRPAEQATLRQMLTVMGGLSADRRTQHDGSRGASCRYPANRTPVADGNVFLVPKGTFTEIPDCIGQVELLDWGPNFTRVRTVYSISDLAGELHVWKFASIELSMPEEPQLPEGEYITQLEPRGVYEWENELGLSFVSEQDARDVLANLSNTVPYARH